MNVKTVVRIVSAILLLVGASMSTSAVVAWLMGDGKEVVVPLLLSSLITMAVGGCGMLLKSRQALTTRDGFGIVSFVWMAATVFGAVPYVWIGELSVVDALFESMSGFTTTGCSILTDIEALPYGLLYWRSLTQWLGGMGIVVLSLAILPLLGIGSVQLFKAEGAGPTSDQLTPRIASSSKVLWGFYIVFSLLLFLLLWPAMGAFDAICHAFTTLATGGFSPKNASVGHYNSAYVEIVITIFMLLGGTSFVLHFRALAGDRLAHWRDEEFRFYVALIAALTFFVSLNLFVDNRYDRDVFTIGRHAFFAVASMLTTAGFATEDFDRWPVFTRALLVGIIFFGACAGSTTGSMKLSRLILLLKYALVQLRKSIYPRSVVNIRLNNQRISEAVMSKTLGFFFIYMSLFFFLSLAICFTEPGLKPAGVDAAEYSRLDTAFSATATCLGNVGPGLGQVGPSENFAWMAPHTKLLLILAMLAGRLEFFTLIVLFLPVFWRR
jgi:trk system potassium uptake protein TrkH